VRDALRHIAKEHHAQGAGLQIGEHKASAAPATSRIHFNESEQALIESPKLQALKHGYGFLPRSRCETVTQSTSPPRASVQNVLDPW
jgi:hypothetical protein